jgi:hypothetical protein
MEFLLLLLIAFPHLLQMTSLLHLRHVIKQMSLDALL